MLKIQLEPINSDDYSHQPYIISTSWPDTLNILNDDTIMIDISVCSTDQFETFPRSFNCKIIDLKPPLTCRCVYLMGTSKASKSSYLGLSVANNFYLKDNSQALKLSFGEFDNNQDTLSIITSHTLIINSPIYEKKKIISSYTSIVETLFNSMINPLLIEPNYHLLRGLLLLGPPGVGKTYSIKLLQEYCKDYFEIVIHDLNVSDILTSTDPINNMNEIFLKSFISKNKSTENSNKIIGNSGLKPYKSESPNSPKYVWTPKNSLNDKLTFNTLEKNFGPHDKKNKLTKSEDHIRKENSNHVKSVKPKLSIIVIDEIDALGKSENQTDIQACIKSTLLSWFDKYESIYKINDCYQGRTF